jgi:hypothetical protein
MAIKNHNFGLKFCGNTNDPTENKKDQMKSEKLQMFKILLQAEYQVIKTEAEQGSKVTGTEKNS